MSDIKGKQLGKILSKTTKRVLPLQFTIPFGVFCVALGISSIFFGPAVRAKNLARQQQAPQNFPRQRPFPALPGQQKAVNGDEATIDASFVVAGVFFLILGLVFGVVGSLLSPWELQIREKGLTYRKGSATYSMAWDDIAELNVYLASRPMPYYHLRSRKMKRKVILWLFEGEDNRMIELLDKNVPVITYWKNRFQKLT